ncbi:unnamed protein product, partial [Brassica napus]
MAIKPNGKSLLPPITMTESCFSAMSGTGPHETQLRFRLIHFWEAWNPLKKTLIGIEMLLIDEEGSVIQGFISPSRIERHLSKMKPGSLYKLNNFYGSSNKTMYRVSDHAVTVSFSWNSELSVLEDSPTLLMKTDSVFIPLRNFKLAVIAKETSTVISVIPHTI